MSVNKKDGDFAPKSRQENLVVQELEGEILIYDLEKNKAFCLNETSALVWQSCDGNRTIAGISDEIGKRLNSQVNEDMVWLALDLLSRENLIEKNDEVKNKFKGLSRREAVKKVGLASLVALPLIVSLTAPVAAQTGSCTTSGPVNLPVGSSCTRSCVCNSGCCKSNNSGGSGMNTCQPSGGAVTCYDF